MARRSYDRMYKKYEEPVEEKVEIPEKKEEIKETIEKKEEKKVEEPKKKTLIRGTVTGGLSLNVRKQPSTAGEIVGSLKDGANVIIVDDSYADWYKIMTPEGFVMRKFVQVN